MDSRLSMHMIGVLSVVVRVFCAEVSRGLLVLGGMATDGDKKGDG
jgi:hypothetical protein